MFENKYGFDLYQINLKVSCYNQLFITADMQ